MKLGQAYSKLAKTPWVSTPLAGGGSIDDQGECFWEGLIDTCKAITTFADAIGNNHGSRVISASVGTSTTLRAEISLDSLLQQRVIQFPPNLMSRISDKMRGDHITATLDLDSRKKLRAIRYQGHLSDGGHSMKVNINFSYNRGDQTAIPKKPKSHDVTNLKKKSQVDHFNDEMAKMGN